jgi:hypothetical protein
VILGLATLIGNGLNTTSIYFKAFAYTVLKFRCHTKKGTYIFTINTPIRYSDKSLNKQNHGRGCMGNLSNKDKGIRLLIQKYRNEFRRPENIDFYSENDYKKAEKKFVKLCLTGDTKLNSNRGFTVKE